MDKEFFDRQLRVGLDFDPLTKDWPEAEKIEFVNHMSAHILNNWAMVEKRTAAVGNEAEATPLKQPHDEINPVIKAYNALGIIVLDSTISWAIHELSPKAFDQVEDAFNSLKEQVG